MKKVDQNVKEVETAASSNVLHAMVAYRRELADYGELIVAALTKHYNLELQRPGVELFNRMLLEAYDELCYKEWQRHHAIGGDISYPAEIGADEHDRKRQQQIAKSYPRVPTNPATKEY